MLTRRRPPHAGRIVLIVALLLVLSPGTGVQVHAAEFDSPGLRLLVALLTRPSQISGTVRLDGCVPDPATMAVIASPITFGAGGREASSPDQRAALPEARFTTTGDPHTLQFVIRGTRPRAIYRLAVGMAPASGCGRVFWRGPALGLVSSGAGRVEIQGVAARTELEIASGMTGEWTGADDVRFSEPNGGLRRLRWRSSLPEITGGELQIATEAFPLDDANSSCAEPPGGIVFRQQLTAGDGRWADVPVLDFGSILRPGRVGGAPNRSTDAVADPDGGPGVTAVSLSTYRMLLAGAPIYARVVPYRGSEPACERRRDGVSGWVVLAQLPSGPAERPDVPDVPKRIIAGSGHQYAPPYFFATEPIHPTYTEFAYKIIKPHKLPVTWCVGLLGSLLQNDDPLGCVLLSAGVYAPGATVQPGPWFYFTPQPPKSSGGNIVSFLTGSFTFFITGAIDAAGQLVDTAAEVWEDVKAAVVKIALELITVVPGMDAACDAIESTGATSCKGLIEAGMTVALASAGMPPSLPNWEQLKDQGIDYVASQVASEIAASVSPVPPAVTEAVLEELAKQAIAKMTASRGGSDPKTNWVLPYNGFDPATWTVTIDKTDQDSLPTLWLKIPETPLFQGAQLPLPTIWPSSGRLTIPIVLRPNVSGINSPYCWSGWTGTGCFGIFPPSAPPQCVTQDFQPGGGLIATDCAQTPWTGIYYRDRWIDKKLTQTPCTDVKAWTIQEVNGLLFPAPDAYKMLVFGRLRPQEALSWNGAFVATCVQ